MSKIEEFQQALKQGQENGLVKVGIPVEGGSQIEMEWVWAEPVDGNIVKIMNVPFFSDEVGFHDLVEVSGDEFRRAFVKVVEHRYDTMAALYDADNAEELYPQIFNYFQSKDFHVEGGCPGVIALAVPCAMKLEDVEAIVAGCPVSVRLALNEDYYDDEIETEMAED